MNLKLPKNSLIPIPPMTKRWGQIPCTMEIVWKRGRARQVIVEVPVFKNQKPERVTYEMSTDVPRIQTVDNICGPLAQSFYLLWCKEHKRPCYEFYFPVGTRFIDCSDLSSSLFCKFRYVLAKYDDLNGEEKRVLSYHPESTKWFKT